MRPSKAPPATLAQRGGPRLARAIVFDEDPRTRDLLERSLRRLGVVDIVGRAGGLALLGAQVERTAPQVLLVDPPPGVERFAERLAAIVAPSAVAVVLFSRMETAALSALARELHIPPEFVLEKPETEDALAQAIPQLAEVLAEAARGGINARIRQIASSLAAQGTRSLDQMTASAERVVAIGASTGGTEAIAALLTRLPVSIPGLVIVQHMLAGFTQGFTERLNSNCAIEVRVARHLDDVRPGVALVAPGGMQMSLTRAGATYRVKVEPGPAVGGHCPSVDVLFGSVARSAREKAVGVLLTGMGADGASGLLAMRNAGARTLAQDEATSVVFGMPREGWINGGAERLVPLGDMAREIVNCLLSPLKPRPA